MTDAALAPLLAHQGGWDEFLLVALPVAFFACLLWIANHRAKAQAEAAGEGEGGAPDDADADAPTNDPRHGGPG